MLIGDTFHALYKSEDLIFEKVITFLDTIRMCPMALYKYIASHIKAHLAFICHLEKNES